MIVILVLAAIVIVVVGYIYTSNLSDVKVNVVTITRESNAITASGAIENEEIAYLNNDNNSNANILVHNNNDPSAMLAKGDIAMGFDRSKIMHHFLATSIGGQIMVVALDKNDNESIRQIKSHILDIQQEFSQGNFTKPFFIPSKKYLAQR
jgi:hypothetical protein